MCSQGIRASKGEEVEHLREQELFWQCRVVGRGTKVIGRNISGLEDYRHQGHVGFERTVNWCRNPVRASGSLIEERGGELGK